jgi:hypothetical protein
MYAALWRVLPGPRWLKIIEAVTIVILVLSVCVEWLFPWIAATFIQSESTVGQ